MTNERSDESRPYSRPETIARDAGLKYVTDEKPGYTRRRRGKGFSYHDRDGELLDGKERERIEALVIPPAWTDVWISPSKKGHIQATGRDDEGRKQYIYHEKWEEARDRVKFSRMIGFAESLPKIRSRVDTDLRTPSLSRERLLALVVDILDATGMRVGNRQYAGEHGAYGVTTLRKKHVETRGSTLHIEFTGKSGVEQSIDVTDQRIVRAIRRFEEIPGYEIFTWVNEDGERRTIEPKDVNDWLRETTGSDFTAKDFRTWRGSLLAARALCSRLDQQEELEEKEIRKAIVDVVKDVAEVLGNTPAVCRAHYIHPDVLTACASGDPSSLLKASLDRRKEMKEWLSEEERRLHGFIRECRK